MDSLKILHLSDCLFGSNQVNSARELRNSALKLAEDEYGLKGQVDYIVICGNVTKNHAAASFEAAAPVFGEMADQLLKPDKNGEIWRSRVLIVPGHNDVGKGDDYTNFKNFHDEFFKRDINHKKERMEKFEPNKAIFRNLKDLTLIGLCHWNVDDPNYTARSLESLLDVIEEARDKAQNIGYECAKQTPTLLVSASNIIFNGGDKKDWRFFSLIKEVFKGDFETTLHLFGAGRNAGILPTPLAFNHLGIGTGLRYKDGFWPFNINLIELRKLRRVEEAQASQGPFFRISVFQRLPGKNKPVLHSWINGELDHYIHYIKRPRVTADQFYKEFLERLEKKLKKNLFVVIKGFPGSGKQKFFDYILQRNRLKDQDIYVEDIPPPAYHDENRREAFKQELAAKVESIKAKRLGPDVKVLLVIYDNQLYDLPTGEKAVPFYELLNEVKLHLLNGDIGGVLYLTNNLDFKPPDIIVGDGAEKPVNRSDTIMLPSLNKNEVMGLVNEYAYSVPVDYAHLQSLTGGYYGYTDLILREVERQFHDEVSGAEPLRPDTFTTLVNEALRSPGLKADAEYFKRLFLISEGNYLRNYIERRLEEMINEGRFLDFSPPPVVEFDEAELKREYVARRLEAMMRAEGLDPSSKLAGAKVVELRQRISEEFQFRIKSALDRLCEMGLLQSQGGTTPQRYRLVLMAPFLVDKILFPALQEEPEEPEPPITDAPNEAGREVPEAAAQAGTWPPILSKDFNLHADFLIIMAQDDELEAIRGKLARKREVPRTGNDSAIYHYSNLPAVNEGREGVYHLAVMSLGGAQGDAARDKVAKALRKWMPRAVILAGAVQGVAHGSAVLGDLLVPARIVRGVAPDAPEAAAVDTKLHNAAFDFPLDECLRFVRVPRPTGGRPRDLYHHLVFDHDPAACARGGGAYCHLPEGTVAAEPGPWGDVLAVFEKTRPNKLLAVHGVAALAGGCVDAAQAKAWRSYACHLAASYVVAYLRNGPLWFSARGRKSARAARAGATKAAVAPPPVGENHFEYAAFMSHSRPDKEQIFQIRDELEKAGLKVWFDDAEIRSGDHYLARIDEGISRSRKMLVFVSPNERSPWVDKEYASLLDEEINSRGSITRVVVVLIGGADKSHLPPRLKDKTPVVYGKPEWLRLIEQLRRESGPD